MKQIKSSKYEDGAMETQSAKNKKPSIQNDNNISLHLSKGDDNAQGKRIIEEACVDDIANSISSCKVIKPDNITNDLVDGLKQYSIRKFKNNQDVRGESINIYSIEEFIIYLKNESQNNNLTSLYNAKIKKGCTKEEAIKVVKNQVPALIFGETDGKGRCKDNIKNRNVIALDIDEVLMPHLRGNNIDTIVQRHFEENDDFIFDYFAYSTASHTLEKPKMRILIPTDRLVVPEEYPIVVKNLVKKLGLHFISNDTVITNDTLGVDKGSCEYTKLMYAPCIPYTEYQAVFIQKIKGRLLCVNDFLTPIDDGFKKVNEISDIETAYYNLPISNLSSKQVRDYLSYLNSETMEYKGGWLLVVFALHHQYQGGKEGYDILLEWSLKDNKRTRKDIEDGVYKHYYKNAKLQDKKRPITFATIIQKVNELNKKARQESLCIEINKLSQSSTEKEVEKIINTLALDYTENESEFYLQQIKEKTKWQISNLRNIFKIEQNKIEYSKSKALPVIYSLNKPLPRGLFVNDTNLKKAPKATYANFLILLDNYNIKIRYNLISKGIEVIIPDRKYSMDNEENTSLGDIINICTLNSIDTKKVNNYIIMAGEDNKYNPVLEFIESKPWDGISRLNELYDTIKTQSFFPLELKELLFRKWLISAVAPLHHKGFYSKGVLVFQGYQSLGKTPWFKKLLPLEIERYFMEGHSLNLDDKDSIIIALSNWIVELGEIDSTFKKDIAKLKAFISKSYDTIRRPYDAKNSNYPRRTIFCGTVNPDEFLKDHTGNVRFWVIPVVKINYEHNIDMQQVWAEINQIFKDGERWWLIPDEENKLETQNKRYIKSVGLDEGLLDHYDFNNKITELYSRYDVNAKRDLNNKKIIEKLLNLGCKYRTVSNVLMQLGYCNVGRGHLVSDMVTALSKLGVPRSTSDKKYLMPPI